MTDEQGGSTEATTPAKERLHPAYFLTGFGKAARNAFGAIAAAAYFGASGSWWLAILIGAGFLAVTITGLWLRWIRFSYLVTDNEIVIESGLLSTQHRSIPFERVQDVNVEQGPVARMLGIARVRLETGASAGTGDDEGVLEAIALPRAYALRDRIRRHRSGTPIIHDIAAGISDDSPDEESDTPLFAMSRPRVLQSGVYNFSLAVFAVLGGLFQFGNPFGFDVFERLFWESILDSDSPVANYVLTHRWISAVAGLAGLVLIGIATGVIRTLLRDDNFRLTRTETGLRRRRGLLTLTDVIIPIKRVQAAIVSTGPIRRLSGWHGLRLQSLARDEGGQGDHEVAPFAKMEEFGPVMDEIAMRLPRPDIDWQRIDKAHPLILSIPLVVVAIAAAVVGTLLQPLAFVGMGAALVIGVGHWLAWRRYYYALDGRQIFIRKGFWRQRMVILPVANIQSIDIAQSFVSRVFGVVSMEFGVAGGSGLSLHNIAALPVGAGYTLRSRLMDRVA